MQYSRIIGVYRIKWFLYLAENKDYGCIDNQAETGAGTAQAVAKGYAAEAPFKAIVLGVYTQVQYEMPPLRERLQGFCRAQGYAFCRFPQGAGRCETEV